METCKAIIQEGGRKGLTCQFPPSSENAYCGRHQRHLQYEKVLREGKIPCRFFFRGCDVSVEKKGSCASCKVSLQKKTVQCGHEGCKFKTTGYKYCNKHLRDIYYDEEKAKGIKYCDIARGCLTICKNGYTKCDECRNISYNKEKDLRAERNRLHDAIEQNGRGKNQICVNCGQDYEQYMTKYNKPSKLCTPCNKNNLEQDAKRENRARNFKNENYNNIERLYRDYITGAAKRGYEISINFEEFKELVVSKCYYCHYTKEKETNGIDRLNNDIGYTKENCVPCCEICNMMKHYYHPLFFIELCKIITGIKKGTKKFYLNWKEYYGRTNYHNHFNYKKNTESIRKMPFNITKEDWTILIKEPCYLCGFQNNKGIGLDRVDNTKREYTLDNVKPCCGTCNNLKGSYSLETIRNKAKLISDVWQDTNIFESIPRTHNPMRESRQKPTPPF